MAEPAAERQAADPGGRDDPARRGEAVLARCRVHLTPGASAADPYRARLGIDLDVLQQRQVDHDAVVAGAEPRRRCGRRRGWPASAPRSRANATTLATSWGFAQRAISAGRRSIIAL